MFVHCCIQASLHWVFRHQPWGWNLQLAKEQVTRKRHCLFNSMKPEVSLQFVKFAKFVQFNSICRILCYENYKNRRWQVFYEGNFYVGNFTKLIRKHICRGLFFYEVADQAFNFCKIFRVVFLSNFGGTVSEIYREIRGVATTPVSF